LASAQRIVLRTSTILDGKGAVLKDRRIIIEGSRIQSISSGNDSATYDLRGLTVMPGWIDTHVHLNWHFDANRKLVNGKEDPQNSALYTAENAWLTLEAASPRSKAWSASRRGCARSDQPRIAARAAHSHVGPPDQ
jgi:imidazolonepropionase-like amidohydrolase